MIDSRVWPRAARQSFDIQCCCPSGPRWGSDRMPARIVLASMDDRRESTAVIPHMWWLLRGIWREGTQRKYDWPSTSATARVILMRKQRFEEGPTSNGVIDAPPKILPPAGICSSSPQSLQSARRSHSSHYRVWVRSSLHVNNARRSKSYDRRYDRSPTTDGQ